MVLTSDSERLQKPILLRSLIPLRFIAPLRSSKKYFSMEILSSILTWACWNRQDVQIAEPFMLEFGCYKSIFFSCTRF